MTEHAELMPGEPFMPAMDAVYRFMRSNPLTTCEMLVEVLGAGDPPVSAGRFRELWKIAGGSVDKKGRAWVEMDFLAQTLLRIVNSVNALHDPEKCLGGLSCPICSTNSGGADGP